MIIAILFLIGLIQSRMFLENNYGHFNERFNSHEDEYENANLRSH